MPIKILIPTPLRAYTNKLDTVEVKRPPSVTPSPRSPRNSATCANIYIMMKAGCAAS
jgi:hypothetical protein